MRIIEFGPEESRPVDLYASHGFTVAPLSHGQESTVACVRLTPGGLIGPHEAVGRQVLAIVVGNAVVSGADGVELHLSAGQAAVWEAGEIHQTRSVDGLTAIVIEDHFTTTT